MNFTFATYGQVKRCFQHLRFFQEKRYHLKYGTDTVISIFVTRIHVFEYDEREKSEKWMVKSEIQGKRPFLKVNNHFNPVNITSSSKNRLSENGVKNIA